MLEAQDVERYYGARRAVAGLSFRLDRGSCVGLLGLNGAGKSTTLRMLAGVLSPTRGKVLLEGQPLVPRAHGLRARIGFLPDRPPLYGEMRVDEYLRFAAKLRGLRGAACGRRVEAVLEMCDLNQARDEIVDQLSHGYRQRVGIAQAIVHEPALVVLDEPSQGLDPAQRIAMRGLVERLTPQHTLVLSTHLLDEISRSCDRILWIHRGELLADATETELMSRFVGGERTLRVVVGGTCEGLVARLAALEGVREVSVVSADSELVLRVRANADARGALSRTVVGQGCDLLELSADEEGLEAVFTALLSRDQGERGFA